MVLIRKFVVTELNCCLVVETNKPSINEA